MLIKNFKHFQVKVGGVSATDVIIDHNCNTNY